MIVLIDGDSPIYRAAAAAQKKWYLVSSPEGEELDKFQYKKDAEEFIKELGAEVIVEDYYEVEQEYAAIHNIRSIMGTILSYVGNRDYALFLGGDGNYRKTINPEYKAGRPPRPYHYDAVKRRLIEEFGAQVVNGMEADDAISIEQYRNPEENIIVTIDKDLDMVPGWHYNWVKDAEYYITEEEGELNFYTQLLTGDRTDNIVGLRGVGPVAARRILEDAKDSQERWLRCVAAYEEAGRNDIDLIARQIWMCKKEADDWVPPILSEDASSSEQCSS